MPGQRVMSDVTRSKEWTNLRGKGGGLFARRAALLSMPGGVQTSYGDVDLGPGIPI